MALERERKVAMEEVHVFDVSVKMSVGESGREVDSKTIDFGKVSEDQLRALKDLFSMIASNVDAIRSMSPLYEELSHRRPSYLK